MRLRDEQGMMAIGVVIMLMFVLPLFGGVLWQYSMAELKRTEGLDQDIQALFLAQAGAELFMGALQQRESSDPMPYGSMEPVYYDLTNKCFTSDKPADFLGPIDVEIREEDATEGGERRVTVIEATATVGSTQRTVKLVTYPVRYGHDNSLLWYEEESGLITPSTGKAPKDLVIMRTKPREGTGKPGNNPIHFGLGVLWESSPLLGHVKTVTNTAQALVFESPLQLVSGAQDVGKSDSGEFTLVLDAERIFLHGLEIAYLPEYSSFYRERNYRVQLTLPEVDGKKVGKLGSEIADKVEKGKVDPNALYGEVYFGNEPVTYRSYRWKKEWWDFLELFLSVQDNPSGTSPSVLSKKGYFFRDGWTFDFKNYLQSGQKNFSQYFKQLEDEGWLLPIDKKHQIDPKDLDGLQPFFWEQ